jgi:SAM-dependent methyltransferase
MFSSLLDQAIQHSNQRVREAFAEFSQAELKQNILQLDHLNQLPSPEKIIFPYRDLSFDWVACYELIECYSTHERQVRLLRELLRIARKGIFISTINRYHPASTWLKQQHSLALLTAFDLKALVDVLPGRPFWKLGHVRVMGLKAYFFLMIWKEGFEPAIENSQIKEDTTLSEIQRKL